MFWSDVVVGRVAGNRSSHERKFALSKVLEDDVVRETRKVHGARATEYTLVHTFTLPTIQF